MERCPVNHCFNHRVIVTQNKPEIMFNSPEAQSRGARPAYMQKTMI